MKAQHPALRGRKFGSAAAELRAARAVPPGWVYEEWARVLETQAQAASERAQLHDFRLLSLQRMADDPSEPPEHREHARRHLVRVMNGPYPPYRQEAHARRRWAAHARRQAHAARRWEQRWADGSHDEPEP